MKCIQTPIQVLDYWANLFVRLVANTKVRQLFRQPTTLLNFCFRFDSREQIRLLWKAGLKPVFIRQIYSRYANRKLEFSNLIGWRKSSPLRQPTTLLNARKKSLIVESQLNAYTSLRQLMHQLNGIKSALIYSLANKTCVIVTVAASKL